MAKPLGKRRTEVEIRAVSLARQGWTQVAIAAELGLHQSSVSRVLQAFRESAVIPVDAALRRRLLQLIDRLEHIPPPGKPVAVATDTAVIDRAGDALVLTVSLHASGAVAVHYAHNRRPTDGPQERPKP